MMEDANEATDDIDAGPGPYPQSFEQQQQLPFTTGPQGMPLTMAADDVGRTEAHAGFGQIFDPADPVLDADPFGLTASMHFPTPFSFQESSMRR